MSVILNARKRKSVIEEMDDVANEKKFTIFIFCDIAHLFKKAEKKS